MQQVFQSCCRLAFVFLALNLAETAAGQSLPVVHLINSSSQNATTTLSGGNPFVTNFKATNDATITLSGDVAPLLTDDYPATGNNPSYLTNFTGASVDGTGDGSPGGLTLLTTVPGANSTTLQFDFADPLTPSDRLIVADVDNDEVLSIQAFTKNGATYQPASLMGWNEQPFTGLTDLLPNNDWPTWNPVAGTLTASGARLSEPLNILTPDQPIDRIILTQVAGNLGNIGIQFMTVPEPSTTILVAIGAISLLAYNFRRGRPSPRI